jgi:hypothetical protein
MATTQKLCPFGNGHAVFHCRLKNFGLDQRYQFEVGELWRYFIAANSGVWEMLGKWGSTSGEHEYGVKKGVSLLKQTKKGNFCILKVGFISTICNYIHGVRVNTRWF